MKKIVFIKIGSFSGYNAFIVRFFKKYFPDVEVLVIDVWKDLIPYDSRGHVFHALREYGLRVLWKNYATAVLRTGFFYDRVRMALKDRLHGRDFLFTFQTGSFFDGSLPGIPHFVYLDASQISVMKQVVSARPFLGRLLWRDIVLNHEPGGMERIRKDIAESIQDKFVREPSRIARERAVFENAERVFTMSEYDRSVLVNEYHCPPDKTIRAYSGPHVFPDRISGRPPYESKKILFIGSEWERKGGPELLTAFCQLQTRHPEATLTIVGCSPRVKADGCVVLGRVPEAEIRKHYQQASIFCVPARAEAFGNVFIEAQYFGLPVVATRIGALPEIVRDGRTGYLVPPGDSRSLAAALGDLMENPQRCRDFGRGGAAWVRDNYHWKKTEDILRASMKEVLA